MQNEVFRRARLLSYAKPSSSLPFSLSTSRPSALNIFMSACPPPSPLFPVLAFPSVKTKTYSRAGTDATMQLRAASPSASPVAFSEQVPSAFCSVPCPGVFYPGSCLRSSDVLGAALPSRLDFSIVDTFAYSRVPSEHSSSPRFGSHVSRGGGVPTLLPQAPLPRETISLCRGASPPVDAVGRLVLSASTSSRIIDVMKEH